MVQTLAGSNGTAGAVDGVGTAAQFFFPTGIAVNSARVVYVADSYNNLIRAFDAESGLVTTLAGGAGGTDQGCLDGVGTAATFYWPYGVAVDGVGTVFVADTRNHLIRAIDVASRVVTTLAGGGSAGNSSGSSNGVGSAAAFYRPYGITVDGAAGKLFVSDSFNNLIRAIVVATGSVTTLAGKPTAGRADATGSAAAFNEPRGITFNGIGTVYVADYTNRLIRSIVVATGVVTTLAGGGSAGGTGFGTTDGVGSAALFNGPYNVAADNAGNVYVADINRVRAINVATGLVSTFPATSGHDEIYDGVGTAAIIVDSIGLAFDSTGIVGIPQRVYQPVAVAVARGVAVAVAHARPERDGVGLALGCSITKFVAICLAKRPEKRVS